VKLHTSIHGAPFRLKSSIWNSRGSPLISATSLLQKESTSLLLIIVRPSLQIEVCAGWTMLGSLTWVVVTKLYHTPTPVHLRVVGNALRISDTSTGDFGRIVALTILESSNSP